jgi:hypothetical protein
MTCTPGTVEQQQQQQQQQTTAFVTGDRHQGYIKEISFESVCSIPTFLNRGDARRSIQD